MSPRREPRFQTDQPVMVTVLTDCQACMDARVRNVCGRGLGLFTPSPVNPGAAIRIEIDDSMVLGEAVYCRNEPEGHFLGVELDQVLVGLTELGRNLAAFAPKCAVEAPRP